MKRAVLSIALGILGLSVVSPKALGQTLPPFGHVIIVAEENHSYSESYSSSSMPTLTKWANANGLATNYYAETHPGNYFTWVTGQILSNDYSLRPSPSWQYAQNDNIAHELELAGETWKDYAEKSGDYSVNHDPLQFFYNINRANLVDFSHFQTDLANHALPNFSFVVPNGCDDAHDCSLSKADTWLSKNIGPLLSSSYFQGPNADGLLIIVFDEDDDSGTPDCTTNITGQGCGGKVECVLVSPFGIPGHTQTSSDQANYNGSYEEENVLSLMARALSLNTTGLGAANTAVDMSEFFNATSGSASISPASLSFTASPGTTSASQVATLNNGTSATVSGVAISISGSNSSSFSQTNNCPASLPSGASCTINVFFSPAATGNFTATLSTGVSGVTAALSGAAAATTVSVSPASLAFSSQSVGTTSSPQTVTLINTGTTTLTINNFGISGDFAFSNNCGSSVAPGQGCSISVTFTPTAAGTRTGTLTVNDNASNSPQTVSLTGTGTSATGGGGAITFYSKAWNAYNGSTVQSTITTNTTATAGVSTFSVPASGLVVAYCGIGTATPTNAAPSVSDAAQNVFTQVGQTVHGSGYAMLALFYAINNTGGVESNDAVTCNWGAKTGVPLTVTALVYQGAATSPLDTFASGNTQGGLTLQTSTSLTASAGELIVAGMTSASGCIPKPSPPSNNTLVIEIQANDSNNCGAGAALASAEDWAPSQQTSVAPSMTFPSSSGGVWADMIAAIFKAN